MTWTLEQELIAASPVTTESWTEALLNLKVLRGPTADGVRLQAEGEWYAGGAETYIYRFSVCEPDGRVTQLLLKACVSLSGFGGTSYAVESWLRRRKVLETHGVRTSRVFAVKSSTLIEEWVPMTLEEAIAEGDTISRARVAAQVGALGATLESLHFAPTSLHDLRSHGDDVVMIDFGVDLGESSEGRVFHMLPLVMETSRNARLNHQEQAIAEAAYSQGLADWTTK